MCDHKHSCEHNQRFGCEQNLDEIEFEKSIFYSSVLGDLNRVQSLIKSKGISILNNQDRSGYSCLHYAVRNGHYDLCEYLIKNGINVDLKTKNCQSTALHRAAFIGNKKILKLLIENKSNPFEKDCDGKTPLHKCVEEYLRTKDEKYLDCIHILVQFKPDLVHIKNNFNISSVDLCPELFKNK